MKKIKILIIVMVAILIIISICLVIMLLNKKTENISFEEYTRMHDEEMEKAMQEDAIENNKLINITSKSDYVTIKKILDDYIQSIEFININPSEENIARLYEKLDDEYIKLNKITKDNIVEHFKNYGTNNEFCINRVLIKDIYDLMPKYVIYGRLINKENNIAQDYGFIMLEDQKNRTYSLLPYDYMKDKELLNLQENEIVSLPKKESIELKNYNTYVLDLYSDLDVMKIYFKDLANNIKYDRDSLYKLLDKDYKEKKFKSFEEFEKFVQKFNDITLQEYIIDEENYAYICKDQYENVYTFKINTVANYSIMLDNYTIDSEKFITQYNATSNQGKVALDIEKFVQAINVKDYNYAYNCLADGFKNNYFGTLEEFERYIVENLFGKNEIEYIKFEEEKGIYKYTVTINNLDNLEESIQKTIIMKLNEEREFEMSFNV